MVNRELINKDSAYSYNIQPDILEALMYGFTSDKYSGYIFVDYGEFYLYVNCIDGSDNDLAILKSNITALGNTVMP